LIIFHPCSLDISRSRFTTASTLSADNTSILSVGLSIQAPFSFSSQGFSFAPEIMGKSFMLSAQASGTFQQPQSSTARRLNKKHLFIALFLLEFGLIGTGPRFPDPSTPSPHACGCGPGDDMWDRSPLPIPGSILLTSIAREHEDQRFCLWSTDTTLTLSTELVMREAVNGS